FPQNIFILQYRAKKFCADCHPSRRASATYLRARLIIQTMEVFMLCEIEMLESRFCLSAAVTPGATLNSNGVLSVVGDRAAANTISVKLSSDGTQIDTAIGSDTNSFALADVKRIVVMGGDQADTINVDLTDANLNFSTVIIGRAGDDTITGGGENDVIWGRAGDDVIDAGAGDDRVFGGDGDDVITGSLGDD